MFATTVEGLAGAPIDGKSAGEKRDVRPSGQDPGEGLRLMQAFVSIQDASVRVEIVRMVEEIGSGPQNENGRK